MCFPSTNYPILQNKIPPIVVNYIVREKGRKRKERMKNNNKTEGSNTMSNEMKENYKWYVKSVLVNPPFNEYKRWNLFDMSVDMCSHIYGDLYIYEDECEEIFDEMYKTHKENPNGYSHPTVIEKMKYLEMEIEGMKKHMVETKKKLNQKIETINKEVVK